MKINRAELHKVEMELVYLFENGKLTEDKILDKFTDLMGMVEE